MTEARVSVVEHNPQDEFLGPDKKAEYNVLFDVTVSESNKEAFLKNPYGDGISYVVRHSPIEDGMLDQVGIYSFPQRELITGSQTYAGEVAKLAKKNPETEKEYPQLIFIEHEGKTRVIDSKVSQE